MRQLFELATIFDWITPSIGFIQDFVNDPTPLQTNSWTYFFNYGDLLATGHNARDLEKLIKSNGIKTWGSQITGGQYFFSLPAKDADNARAIMAKNGIFPNV